MESQLEPRDMYIFQRFDTSELAKLSGKGGRKPYSELYVAQVKSGNQPLRHAFIDRMVAVLGIPEDVLFGVDADHGPEQGQGAA